MNYVMKSCPRVEPLNDHGFALLEREFRFAP